MTSIGVLCASLMHTLTAAASPGDIHGQADGRQLWLLRHWPMVTIGPLSTVSGHDHAHDGQEQHLRKPADED